MVDIIKDKYILGQSENKSLNTPGEEIRLDLNLSLDGDDSIGGIVYGSVQDSFGVPISGALVKLMNMSYDPIMHAVTNVTGNYTLNNVPIDKTFKIYAIAPSKKLKEGSIIQATLSQKTKMDFTLEDDPSKQLALIAGDIFDLNAKTPVQGVVASLYSININGQTLVAVAHSNKYGQFTFREVPLGSYNVNFTCFGYNSNTVSVTASSQGQIIPLQIQLTQDPNNSKGTVSGVIKDDAGNAINRGDVILYRVEQDNTLTPVAFTKTNTEGVYLFENVPQATYKIKSNESAVVTVVAPNSPNYYGFALANSSTLFPQFTDVTEANLGNGAIYVLDNAFVASLGGVTGGTMDIGITSLFSGYFNLSIKYLSGNSDTTIILKEDPDNNGTERTITFKKTNSWDAIDTKSVTINIPLCSGMNQFKLFNTENTPTPWIGNFSMLYVPYSFSIEANTGTISNGAIKGDLGFVTMLGGSTNGEVNIPIDIPFSQPYKLGIRYLAGDEDRPLKIDIDGTNQGRFVFPKTSDWGILNAKSYETKISVEEGTKNFRFYNDTGEYAPNISTLTFTEYTVNKTFLPKDIILLDGATINQDISGTQYIGGVSQGKGMIQFVVTVFETQLYDFNISYSCIEDRVCNVKVNDVVVEYEEFYFVATGGSIGTFSCRLFLEEGQNTISIYNE